MKWLEDMKLAKKFAIGGAVSLIMVTFLLFVIVAGINEKISIAAKERDGLVYHTALRGVLRDVQAHRGAATGMLSAKAGFKERVAELQTSIEAALKKVDEADRMYGAAFNSEKSWAEWKSAWSSLKQGLANLAPGASAVAHTKLIEQLLDVMDAIGNNSGLVLDPVAESFRLMEVIVNFLPRLTENTGQARAFGMVVIGAGEAKGDVQNRLVRASGGADFLLTNIEKSINYAIEAKSGLKPQLEKITEASLSDTRKLFELVDSKVLGAKIEINAQDYFQSATAAIDAQFRFYDDIAKALDAELAEQIGTHKSERTKQIGLSVLAVLLAGLLNFMIIRGIVRRLAAANKGAQDIAEGRLESEIASAGRDEVGRVLHGFGEVRERLQRFARAQTDMAQHHQAGDSDYRIDASALPGAYGELASKVNELVAAEIEVQNKMVGVFGRYANGDFSADMDELPGKKARITQAAADSKRQLLGITAEIKRLVDAAARGDFSVRGDAAQYQHSYREMVTELNRLVEVCEAGLADANRMFGSLAQADLTSRVTADYVGTFGELKDTSNSTMEQLGEVIARVREATESINTAAREIASGNNDLSSRTEEQASSLEETASSMEELTSTVKQNAENAKQANQLAAGASQIAGRGGETVGQVVATMNAISSSSKRIQDIIGVIDGIAFQTNSLALNAAVEAARAGEQGRGFAVVATEVRNLAQRSAAAAKEIKELITESVGKVDAGTALVEQAGATMEEIVQAVKRVSDIIAEITAASLEQSSGIEQVNQAVTQMDQMTQQNAALVEQAAAASESLQEQATQLGEAVKVFRLGGGADMPARAAVIPGSSSTKASSAKVTSAVVKPRATSAPAGASAGSWSGADRRGPDRAKNVARIAAPKPAPAAKVAAAKVASADGDWEEF